MSDLESLYKIGPIAGLSAGLSDLMSMMNYARYTTIEAVKGLSTQQLDHLHDTSSNSIGALLLHIAAVEHYYSIYTFGLSPEENEFEFLEAALDLGQAGRDIIRGHDLQFYLDTLQAGRTRTMAEFAGRDDDWLRQEHPFGTDSTANCYFMWFHVFEDEVNHRGQIRWLRKRLPEQ